MSDDERTMASINLTPPEPALDARHLDDLIVLWLETGVSAADTASGYAYKVRYFRDWWSAVGPARDWTLRRRDLEAFAAYLETVTSRTGQPLSYHTRNDVLRRLRQMFRWALARGYTEGRDYTPWVPRADGEPPPRQAASMEDLAALFDAAGESPNPARDRTILAVLIGTGIRRGECASIQVEDIRIYADKSGVMTVTGKRTRANRTGRRSVAFDAETGAYLTAYLDLTKLEKGPLFRGASGKALTTQSIYRTVKRCAEAAGLGDQIQGCHDLRRAFATHFARMFKGEGYGDLLRRQMGHKTYRMTSQYSLLDADDIRDSLKSPLSFFEGR